ncbi:hypothetical protein, partial [Arenibaculum sp.]|uniref:hypothetical protein n=1 Tax=Arenibaculum sp. TaxID=2865862 RepID=UPI002E147FA8|nr:hypothetical protein [Arenibaculum sp.]
DPLHFPPLVITQFPKPNNHDAAPKHMRIPPQQRRDTTISDDLPDAPLRQSGRTAPFHRRSRIETINLVPSTDIQDTPSTTSMAVTVAPSAGQAHAHP